MTRHQTGSGSSGSAPGSASGSTSGNPPAPSDTPASGAPPSANLRQTLRRILAARRADTALDERARPAVTPADLVPPRLHAATRARIDEGDDQDEDERDDGETRRRAEWARHVEWTLRMMS